MCQEFCPRGGGGVGVYPSMYWAGGMCIPACTGQGGVYPSMHCAGGVYPSMHWAGGVYPSMHWAGGVYPSMYWAGGVYPSMHWAGRCVSQHALGRGVYPSMYWAGWCGRHPPRADTPPPATATAADGTHPTGMHSCFHLGFHVFAT